MSFDFKGFKMSGASGLVLASTLCGIGALAGCNSVSNALDARDVMAQGYVLDEEALELVPVGSSREQVQLALGSPSTTATFDNEVFYYISQTRVRNAAFMKPKLVNQRVLAIYFGKDDRVEKIANYGMKDGKLFDFISRTTPTCGKDENFLASMISGVAGGSVPMNPFGG